MSVLMVNSPPLPDDWPFEARRACGEIKLIDSSNLPGLTGRWHICSNSAIPDLTAATSLDGIFGRGGLIHAGNYILRPYRRGGLFRHFNKRMYLTANRFRDEYTVHASLWASGYPTVEPLGFAFRRHLWGVEGMYITRWADSQPWPKIWGETDSSNQIMQIARLIKSLTEWGLWAPDMNATNFIRVADGTMLALDWDRAKWIQKVTLMKMPTHEQKTYLAEKYWTRLKRSMDKLNAPQELIESMQQKLMENQ